MVASIRTLCVGAEPGSVADALEGRDALEVVTDASARAVLDRLPDADIDCLVSASRTADMDGVAFLEAVRGDVGADVPVILLADGCFETMAREALSAGATDCLPRAGAADDDLLADRIVRAVERTRRADRASTLEGIRSLVGKINRALVRASTREAIETRVCEAISRAEPYRFAWIGEHDPETGRVEPRSWAGIEAGYLEGITVTADESETGRGPVGTAIREGGVAVSQNVRDDPDFEPWRDAALERGYQSCATVPLTHDGTRYGVLSVYADRPDAFDDRERELLAELGDDVAHAIGALETRRELRRKKDRFRRLVTEVEEYAIFRLDPDGRVTSWNEGARRLKGYTADEIVGEHFSAFYPEETDGMSPEAVLAAAAESGSYEEEGWRVRKDGSRFWAQATVTALSDEAGGLDGFAKVVRDMTERREREQTLRRFRRAVEAAGHAVYITDTDGTIEYVNPAFEGITGYDRDEVIGETPTVLKSGEMEDYYYETLWSTLLAGDTWEEEIVNRRADGTRYHAQQTISPIVDDGTVREFVAIQTDITEHKEREQQLQVLDRVLRHNLRNDLNLVMGIAESIRADSPDAVAESADRLIENARRLLKMVEKEQAITDVLTDEYQRERIEMGTLVRRTVASLEQRYPGADIALEVDDAIASTTTKIERAIAEIVENAIVHAGGDGPRIEVTVARDDATVRIAVADDGPGIPEMERKVLLGQHELDALYHGSGLGLWLVYWIVHRAGGSLRFEENEPRGSVVTIELPAADGETT
jgi:PAS domain S-box-containing protein